MYVGQTNYTIACTIHAYAGEVCVSDDAPVCVLYDITVNGVYITEM